MTTIPGTKAKIRGDTRGSHIKAKDKEEQQKEMPRGRIQRRHTLIAHVFTAVSADADKQNWFNSPPFQQFQAPLTIFSKSFSPFTCLLSVSSQYLG